MNSLHRAVAMCLAALAATTAVRADDNRGVLHVAPLPAYRQECSACHIAYPPALLLAASWQRVMANLPRHFGTDASLDDAATARQIDAWLQVHAADGGRSRQAVVPPPEDRITRSAWFVREHREVTPAAWARPAIKSASNCAACHTRAEQGDFDERHIRIPR